MTMPEPRDGLAERFHALYGKLQEDIDYLMTLLYTEGLAPDGVITTPGGRTYRAPAVLPLVRTEQRWPIDIEAIANAEQQRQQEFVAHLEGGYRLEDEEPDPVSERDEAAYYARYGNPPS